MTVNDYANYLKERKSYRPSKVSYVSYDEIVRKSKYIPEILPEIKKVIFNDPATIVLWGDGTKTVVKAVHEDFDPEKGLAMAIAKKALGNKGNYFNIIKKWTKEYDVPSYYPKIPSLSDTIEEATKSLKNFVDIFSSRGEK